MSTKTDYLKWYLHRIKYDTLFMYGVKKGLIRSYDMKLIENLRHIYYGSLPASILLLHEKLSNGYCYDRGTLVTLGFGDDDFQVVDANIDSLKLNPKYVEKYRSGESSEYYSNHCFAERKTTDGTVWVYDTSVGLVFEKRLYYRMQNPVITKINDRDTTLKFLYDDFQKDSNIERDKYSLPIILPIIEACMIPTQPFYLEMLKQEIGYASLCKEVEEDMKRRKLLR